MQPGEKRKFIALDRNYLDTTTDVNKEGKSYTANYFFRPQIVEYEHIGPALKGKLVWKWMTLQQKEQAEPREFEIMYGNPDYKWYPLIDEHLPAISSDTGMRLIPGKGKPTRKHYSFFDASTPVGWRGPMIDIRHATKLPRVYWLDDC